MKRLVKRISLPLLLLAGLTLIGPQAAEAASGAGTRSGPMSPNPISGSGGRVCPTRPRLCPGRRCVRRPGSLCTCPWRQGQRRFPVSVVPGSVLLQMVNRLVGYENRVP